MNKADECQIVQDLLYSYNENLLNEKSKIFVENHLKECEICKNQLNTIKSNIFNERVKEEKEDKIELTHLLKVNKAMRKLKISLVVVSIILLVFLGTTLYRDNRSNYVVNNAYNKLEELKELDNFKITKRVKYISHNGGRTDDTITEIYYKDGKYKQIIPGTIFFYEDNSNEIIYIYEESKSIEKNNTRIIRHKGSSFEETTGIRSIYTNDKNILQKAKYSIREDLYNGIKCYVVRDKSDNNQYSEIWIDKENFITIRFIENYETYYRETTYDIIINKVLDSDVIFNVNDYNNYTIKDFTKNSDVIIDND